MHESRQGYTEREGVVSDITVTFQVDAECSQRVIECYVINDVADGKTAVAADRKDLEEVFPGQDITVEGSKYLCLSLCETPNEECPLLSITESVTVYVPRGAFSRVAVCTLVKASQASEDRVMQRAIYDALICTAVGRAWREAGYPLIWSNVDV